MGRRERKREKREKREGHHARRDRAAGVAAAAAESRFHAARMLDDGRMGVRVVLVGREGPPKGRAVLLMRQCSDSTYRSSGTCINPSVRHLE